MAECQRYEGVAFIYSIAGCDFARTLSVCFTSPNGVRCFQMCSKFSKLLQKSPNVSKCLQMSPNNDQRVHVFPHVSECLQVSPSITFIGKTYCKLKFYCWHVCNVTICVWGLFSTRYVTISVLHAQREFQRYDLRVGLFYM